MELPEARDNQVLTAFADRRQIGPFPAAATVDPDQGLQSGNTRGKARITAKFWGCQCWGAVAVRIGQLNREFKMSFKKPSLAAALMASMVSAPVLAQTATPSSSPATAESARSGAEMDDANAVRGGFLIPLIAIIAIILGILAATSDGGERPESP